MDNVKMDNWAFCESEAAENAAKAAGWTTERVSGAADAAVKIAAAKATGKVRAFAVLTADPKAYSAFISNSVIDVSGKTAADIGTALDWMKSGFGKNKKAKGRIFYWSDPHFQHRNIIKYCNRPWNSGKDASGETLVTDENVDRMNEDMIRLFNETVGPDDLTWCLGDFALGNRAKIPEIRSRLNGRINLVIGNHDWFHIKDKAKYRDVVDFFYKAGFDRVYDTNVVIDDFIVLSHVPLEFLNANTPFYNVFGHVHDSTGVETWTKSGCCVCVERHGYRPVPMEEIQKKYVELNGKED